jgi:hypothetical protein
MKLKSIVATGLLLSAFAAGNASADVATCSLSVSQSYVPFGQNFSFNINIGYYILPGPWPPTYVPARAPFYVYFFGTKNGVNDIPNGYQHPGAFGYQNSTLSGYGNPASGGFGGTYQRYAIVFDSNGRRHCTTNTVTTTLQ